MEVLVFLVEGIGRNCVEFILFELVGVESFLV